MIKLGTLIQYSNLEIVKEHAEQIYSGMCTNLDNAIQGCATEEAIKQYFGLNYSSGESYYDLISDNNEKFEVKSKKYKNEPDWWMFDNYNYFLENCHRIDHIFFCPIIEGDIYLKFVANPKTFKKYIGKSRYNEGYYYNNKVAIKDGQCFEY